MSNCGQTKVLIVDDEPDIRFLFGRILLKRNVAGRYAGNLAEAIRAVEDEPPSIVFLDNSLPDGRGVDFIPFLKSNYPEMRVIMVTANDSPVDKNLAFRQGADDFLGKPLSLEMINHTLDNLR